MDGILSFSSDSEVVEDMDEELYSSGLGLLAFRFPFGLGSFLGPSVLGRFTGGRLVPPGDTEGD